MISLRSVAALATALLIPATSVNAGTVHFGIPMRAPVSRFVVQPRAVIPHVMLPFGHYPVNRSFAAALSYHGGPVLTPPKIYVVYWGWTSDPMKVRPYMNKFLRGIGGSSWANVVTQYSGSGQGNITNPTGQLGGTWNDTTAIPNVPTDAQIQAEAKRAATHFGVNSNASYVVATAHSHSTSGFGTQYCAYHGYTSSGISYTNQPYMPDAGSSCGANILGHELDGVSIVLGHEYAESETDPALNAWWDSANGEENGDLCAWQGLAIITLPTGKFAVQPTWSNAVNGCAL